MTGDLFQRARAVFDAVSPLPGGAQQEAAERLCGSDEALLAEVRGLLAHSGEAGGFLSAPALGTAFALLPVDVAPQGDVQLIGRTLGVWRVERQIGAGGMGNVYQGVRADGQFVQRAAIKVVRRGMDSDEILQRFRTERQTLASLTHPAIARLVDGGVIPLPDGRPYLVMEYVDGLPIDRYCAEHALSIEQRLRLFVTVCEAVRFAHQNLVIHRDIKPGNILVTAEGAPKLLDFGIAKLLGTPEQVNTTAAQARRLTPEYASPEQIAGLPVSTATDVYSLGVVLYELLSGERPYRFTTRTPEEISRVVGTIDPPAPSAATRRGDERTGGTAMSERTRLRRRLRGDLDTIVMTAIHKEPARRYRSVEALTGDIERYLTGMPITARRDTLAYRVRKFVGRNRAASAAGAAVAFLIVAGVTAVALQARHLRIERDQAYQARDESEAIADFIKKLLTAPDPGEAGPAATVESLLDNAAARIDGELNADPAVQAALRTTIGRTYLALGKVERAERMITQAYQQRLDTLGPGHHDVAESRLDLATVRYEQHRFAEAESLMRQALATHKQLRGESNIDTARVWNDLGAVLRSQGRFDEALDAQNHALKARRASAGPDSLPVAESLNNIALIKYAKGDIAGAVADSRQALEFRRAHLPATHPLVLQSINNVAGMLMGAGNSAEAEPLLREAVDLSRKSLGPDHLSTARTVRNYAVMLVALGRPAEAEPYYRDALRIYGLTMPDTDDRILPTRLGFGICLVALGKDAEAEQQLTATIELARRSQGSAPRLPPAIEALAKVYDRTGRQTEAAALRSTPAVPPPAP